MKYIFTITKEYDGVFYANEDDALEQFINDIANSNFDIESEEIEDDN